MSHTLTAFLLILSASFAFTVFLSQVPLLRIPSAISYLAFGMILQSGLLHLTQEEVHWITQLGDFGLLILMFLSGMEVDVSMLKPGQDGSGPNPLMTGLKIFLETLLICFGAGWVLARIIPGGASPYMLALLFATTSLGVIFPVLEESHILQTAYGQTLLLAALMADFFTMLLVSLFVSVRTSGSWEDLLLALAILPAAAMLYLMLTGFRRVAWIRNLAGDIQTRVRALIALVAAACAFADFTGSEPILGSFLIGMVITSMPFAFKQKVRDYAHGLGYGLLIPVFFISVGLDFHFELFRNADAWMWGPVLLTVAFLVKLIPSWRLRNTFGIKKSIAGGFLLSARLSLVVAAAEIGVRIQALPQFVAESVILVAILTSLIAPVVFVSVISDV